MQQSNSKLDKKSMYRKNNNKINIDERIQRSPSSPRKRSSSASPRKRLIESQQNKSKQYKDSNAFSNFGKHNRLDLARLSTNKTTISTPHNFNKVFNFNEKSKVKNKN